LSVQVISREAAVATSTASIATTAQRACFRLMASANAIGRFGIVSSSLAKPTFFARASPPCQGRACARSRLR